MVIYKCFNCRKELDSLSLRKKVRCPFCGSKLLFKPRNAVTRIKAR